jgi:DNA repair protein RadC
MSQVTLFERPFQEQVKAFKMAEVEINYKNGSGYSDMVKITCSTDCDKYFRAIWSDRMQYLEEFKVLCLNRANMVLGWAGVSQGGISGTVVDPKVIFQIGLKANASSLVFAHNHPSGNVQPSESDIRLTRRLKEAGDVVEIQVLDHLIITPDEYYSFADEGLL